MSKDYIAYKGYLAELSLDLDDNLIVGRVINTADIISFHGKTLEEAKQSFHDVLDLYLETAQKEGIEPSKPYSGKFNLRINPELHRKLTILAKKRDKSLNEVTEELLYIGVNDILDELHY
jgi:predicted HicB family RNase H-like nuclease